MLDELTMNKQSNNSAKKAFGAISFPDVNSFGTQSNELDVAYKNGYNQALEDMQQKELTRQKSVSTSFNKIFDSFVQDIKKLRLEYIEAVSALLKAIAPSIVDLEAIKVVQRIVGEQSTVPDPSKIRICEHLAKMVVEAEGELPSIVEIDDTLDVNEVHVDWSKGGVIYQPNQLAIKIIEELQRKSKKGMQNNE